MREVRILAVEKVYKKVDWWILSRCFARPKNVHGYHQETNKLFPIHCRQIVVYLRCNVLFKNIFIFACTKFNVLTHKHSCFKRFSQKWRFLVQFLTAPYVAVMYALLQLYSVNYCHIRFFCCTQYCIINFDFNP